MNTENTIIETTVGDLICAIHEIVGESYTDEDQQNSITKLVLESLRLRYEV